MSVQFGIASMVFGGVNLGYLQGVNIDFNFDKAQLYAGGTIYPVDVRVHTGSITGNAEFANVTAEAFRILLGGTRTDTSIAVDNTDFPATFALVTTLVTDGITFSITFPKCRSSKLSLAMQRDQHLIPNFDFEVEADDDGSVATIEVGDIS